MTGQASSRTHATGGRCAWKMTERRSARRRRRNAWTVKRVVTSGGAPAIDHPGPATRTAGGDRVSDKFCVRSGPATPTSAEDAR